MRRASGGQQDGAVAGELRSTAPSCDPAILLPGDEERWLDPDLTEPEALVSLLGPYPADLVIASTA